MDPEAFKKTTAYIPKALHLEVRKRALDLGLDLATAINQGLELWMAQPLTTPPDQTHNSPIGKKQA